MDITLKSGRYKSIDDLKWTDIPSLAVISGVNGSGKTQLLELIDASLKNNRGGPFGDVELGIDGLDLSPEEVVFIRSEWSLRDVGQVDLSGLQRTLQGLYNDLRSGNRRRLPANKQALAKEIEDKLGKPISQATQTEFNEATPVDFGLVLGQNRIHEGIEQVFYNYYISAVDKRHAGSTPEEVVAEMGAPPWEVLNRILDRAGFEYSVTAPSGSVKNNYLLRLKNRAGDEIGTSDLSSGEQVIMSLMFWLYNSQNHGRLPKLLLLDEPDAHLHPELTKQFLDVVRDVLVHQYEVRVILTTHSPSTVALAPDGSLFEMRKSAPRIDRPASTSALVQRLSAGLITVAPNTKYVLVEDDDDVSYLTEVFKQLVASGELKASPSIAFIPASTGSGSEKIGGGKTVVEGWTEKLRTFPGLGAVFLGVVDRDGTTSTTDGVFSLDRHSLENYLLDPLHVFTHLVDRSMAPVVPGVAISIGDEYRIRRLPSRKQQAIADTILASVEEKLAPPLSSSERAISSVAYVGRRKVSLPTWFLTRRGKDLLQAFQKAFGGAKAVHLPALLKAYQRNQITPLELREMLKQIQRA